MGWGETERGREKKREKKKGERKDKAKFVEPRRGTRWLAQPRSHSGHQAPHPAIRKPLHRKNGLGTEGLNLKFSEKDRIPDKFIIQC